MAIDTAAVYLWNDLVGAVSWDQEKQWAVFEYDRAFLKKGLDIAPLTMGLNDALRGDGRFWFENLGKDTFLGLPGLLTSALPDKWGGQLVDNWLDMTGRSDKGFNPVERLCYTGTRGMGALEFKPDISPRGLNKAVTVEIEKMMELAQDILNSRTKLDVNIRDNDQERLEAMTDILRIGTSAGGARPKAIIGLNKSGHIISGQAKIPEGYSHWILKFDGVSEKSEKKQLELGQPNGQGRLEYAYYKMATQAGIDMPECGLLEENGRAHFITKRFDRNGNEKIHMQTLFSLAHLDWNPAGSYGYESAFRVMRDLGLGKGDQDRQYRRMVFNALVKNMDDHVKNISYLMDKTGKWSLSPAYDITFSYDPTGKFASRHQLKINGKQDNFTMDDFLQVAHNMEINNPQQIIDQVLDSVQQWPEFADQAGVNSQIAKIIGDLHLSDL
ncbi:MAG: type II toxin-antitoxin system HipA family toxin [Pseudomonadota bacterium]